MKLNIVSPTNSINYVVNWVELNTDSGNFVVQLGHAPMIVWLKKDSMASFNIEDGTTMQVTIKAGIAEIDRTQTTILITHE